ncbi:MAG: sigma-70 family RNA polymerase sigma factor [bacterium]|nr:sigma-70 family RNA polymerase sigma factor [bacterium]
MKLEDQFIKLYDDLSDAIFRHCYFRVFEKERAKELMQEVFIKTWEYMKKGGKIDNPKAFLYKSANNIVIDESRKKKAASLEAMEETGFNPADNTHERLLKFIEGGEMIRLLRKLEPKHRQAISMKYIDDLDIKEIAEVLGETENNITVRIHRGLNQIREILKENGTEI